LLTRGDRNTVDGFRPGAGRAAMALLFVALGYAAVDHGAFFRTGFRVVILVVLTAAVLSLSNVPASVKDLSGPVVAVLSLAAWYVVSAIAAGDAASAAPALEMLVAIAAVIVVVRRAPRRQRELLLRGVLCVGVVVALSGWIGFVWRTTPLALQDTCCGGIWRAASTITYANAAAAVLSASLLVALALLATTERPQLLRLVAFVLLVGVVATFSRGGWIGLLAGLVTLAALDGRRAFVRFGPALVGALIATASLLPSIRLSQSSHVVLASVGLFAGAAVAVMPARRVVIVGAVLALAVVVVPTIRRPAFDGWRAIAHGRFSASSPDRTRAFDAAIRLARDHPVTGVGPGRVDLTWSASVRGLPGQFHLRYAHNEYVQVLAETGVVGFVILCFGVGATGIAVWRSRRKPGAVAAAGCLAAVVALAVHSATDYLWHIPIIPLLGAVLVAVVLPGTEPEPAGLDGDR
jgi:O-antigen ligase